MLKWFSRYNIYKNSCKILYWAIVVHIVTIQWCCVEDMLYITKIAPIITLSLFIIHVYTAGFTWLWLGLWCLTPLSTIFQLYCESVLLVEETRVPGKKPPICHKSLTNFIEYRVHLTWMGFVLAKLVVGF